MPHYIYTAMDAKGRELKGKLEAANEAEAISAIKKMGMYPSSLQEFTPKGKAGAKGGAKKKNSGGFDINNLSFGPKVIKKKDDSSKRR